MLTKERQLDIDPGLTLTFDGKKYIVVVNDALQTYSVGSLICEYMRVEPTKIKELIISCPNLDEKVTEANVTKAFKKLQYRFKTVFPAVGSIMVELEFLNAILDWFNAVRTGRVKEFILLFDKPEYEEVKNYIFKDTGYSGCGGDSILQLFLTCYFGFSYSYTVTKALFLRLMDENGGKIHDDAIGALSLMFGKYIDMQHIDYRILASSKGFENLYTIKTSLSLLIFEMAQCMNTDAKIVKCKNCGHYFVPEGKVNTVYCSYPIQDNRGKTCKDVGAQVTRAKKEKGDVATKEYRKVYMRYVMMAKRHPEDKEVADKLIKLKSEVKIWRNKLADGSAETEDYLEWLRQY